MKNDNLAHSHCYHCPHCHQLATKPTISISDVELFLHQHQHDEPYMHLIGVIYARSIGYCHSIELRMGVPHTELDEVFHQFIHDTVCRATHEHLVKMACGLSYTGTCLKNYIIAMHRGKKKPLHFEDIEHVGHPATHDDHPFEIASEQLYCEQIIKQKFAKGDLYVAVYRHHLEGLSYEEINEALGIKSAHVIKHRVLEALQRFH